MSLHAAADALYDLAAGLTFNRAHLLAGAATLEASAGDDLALLAAAERLHELASSIPGDTDPDERKKAASLAAFIRQVAVYGMTPGAPDGDCLIDPVARHR